MPFVCLITSGTGHESMLLSPNLRRCAFPDAEIDVSSAPNLKIIVLVFRYPEPDFKKSLPRSVNI